MYIHSLFNLKSHFNAYFTWYFPQVVQKHTVDEVGNYLVNGHLMASCVRNICTRNYLNLLILLQVTVNNDGGPFAGYTV